MHERTQMEYSDIIYSDNKSESIRKFSFRYIEKNDERERFELNIENEPNFYFSKNAKMI